MIESVLKKINEEVARLTRIAHPEDLGKETSRLEHELYESLMQISYKTIDACQEVLKK